MAACGPQSGSDGPAGQGAAGPVAEGIAGLVAWYPLDGDARDLRAPDAEATVVGATPAADRGGVPAGALAFDGVDDHVTLAGPLLGGRPAFTLALWLRPTGLAPGTVLHEPHGATSALRLRVDPGASVVQFQAGPASGAAPAPIADGEWHHVALTASEAGLTLYVDGVLALRTPTAWLAPADATAAVLGARPGTPPQDHYAGALDELAVYSRVLDASEVASLGTDRPNRLPRANAGPDVDQLGLEVHLDGGASSDADGDPLVHSWDFGDGAQADGVRVSHTYAAAGTYDVTLTVSDGRGGMATDTLRAVVRPVDCDDLDCWALQETWPVEWVALEDTMLELLNARRALGARCGDEDFGPAGPLEMDAHCRLSARLHSADMTTQGYFDHVSLDGRKFDDRMKAAGFRGANPWGENIASGQETAEQAVDGFMNSPPHCRNIMNPLFHVVGLGFATTPAHGTRWTQNFGGSH